MGFFKKALLVTGVPVRPSTKRERFQYASEKLLDEQNELLRGQERPSSEGSLTITRYDALSRIGRLADMGVLSESEFAAEKADILSIPGNELDGTFLVAFEELAQLWTDGVLSDTEMNEEKARLLEEEAMLKATWDENALTLEVNRQAAEVLSALIVTAATLKYKVKDSGDNWLHLWPGQFALNPMMLAATVDPVGPTNTKLAFEFVSTLSAPAAKVSEKALRKRCSALQEGVITLLNSE